MTQEEKAKAYDEAKYIMEEYLKSGNAEVIAENTIKEAFPELAESNDEKTRKWLIEVVEEIRKINPTNADHNGNCSEAIAWLDKQYADPLKEYWRGYNEGKQNVLDKYAELEKQGEKKQNPYSGTSFEYNGHTWGMCARDYGVDILCDKHIIGHLEKQKPTWSEEDESYLNTTIAYLKDAKEFKKTAENCINWLKSLKERIGG